MSTGLGDTVKKITEFFNIEQCEGCKERQAELNRLFPYVVKPTSDEIIFLYYTNTKILFQLYIM